MTQIDEVRGGGSYNSTNDTRLHFGLGTDAITKKVQVRWPSGLNQQFVELSADAIYEITEGQPVKKVTTMSIR
jgi:enediyne biosynthesis protein E4